MDNLKENTMIKAVIMAGGSGARLFFKQRMNQYIPVGVIHALENPGKVNLELIKVQSGSYLGEDDIVRFEDLYTRVKN